MYQDQCHYHYVVYAVIPHHLDEVRFHMYPTYLVDDSIATGVDPDQIRCYKVQ